MADDRLSARMSPEFETTVTVTTGLGPYLAGTINVVGTPPSAGGTNDAGVDGNRDRRQQGCRKDTVPRCVAGVPHRVDSIPRRTRAGIAAAVHRRDHRAVSRAHCGVDPHRPTDASVAGQAGVALRCLLRALSAPVKNQ